MKIKTNRVGVVRGGRVLVWDEVGDSGRGFWVCEPRIEGILKRA